MKSAALRRGWALLRVDGPTGAARAVSRRLMRLSRRSHVVSETAIVASVLSLDGLSNGVMMDIGAHHGAVFAEFAKRGWQVYAFEPDRRNLKRISTAFGDLTNVHVDHRAVSDVSGVEVPFFSSSQSSGISSLSAFDESHTQAGMVTTVSLDDFAEDQDVSRVDYLKIDTEGYDLMVLKGFPWERMRPKVIVCEFEDKKTVPLGYNLDDIAGFISAKGYKVIVSEWFPIASYGSAHRWRRHAMYPCELADECGWGNLIASNDDRLLERIMRRLDEEAARA